MPVPAHRPPRWIIDLVASLRWLNKVSQYWWFDADCRRHRVLRIWKRRQWSTSESVLLSVSTITMWLNISAQFTFSFLTMQSLSRRHFAHVWRRHCSLHCCQSWHIIVYLTPSTPAVPNCCCSKCSPPFWFNPPFIMFDIRALWRSVLSARVPECQKL